MGNKLLTKEYELELFKAVSIKQIQEKVTKILSNLEDEGFTLNNYNLSVEGVLKVVGYQKQEEEKEV